MFVKANDKHRNRIGEFIISLERNSPPTPTSIHLPPPPYARAGKWRYPQTQDLASVVTTCTMKDHIA